jgi:ribosome biogenesis GTPase A
MAINWYPGHMNKAQREIRKAMPRVSLVIEVLDARLPATSANPMVPSLRGDTACLKILNKSDLADPAATAAWLRHFDRMEGVSAMAIHRKKPGIAKQVLAKGRELLPKDRSKNRAAKALILGIPNVGKSTLLNLLAGRNIAKTGNVPAVTRAQQEIRIAKDFLVLDTPGILWPKLSPPVRGYRLALSGAVKDAVIEYEDIAAFGAGFFRESYPGLLRSRYGLEELPEEPVELLEAIARRRGCIGRGGVVQLHKVSEILVREFRSGKLGPITLELPKPPAEPIADD